jgi:hypothetical protein
VKTELIVLVYRVKRHASLANIVNCSVLMSTFTGTGDSERPQPLLSHEVGHVFSSCTPLAKRVGQVGSEGLAWLLLWTFGLNDNFRLL